MTRLVLRRADGELLTHNEKDDGKPSHFQHNIHLVES
jgi:hypothetical protein